MKPRFYHSLLAHFPAIVAQAGGVFLVSVFSVVCSPLWENSSDSVSRAEFVLAVVAAYPLGALLASLFLGPFLYPLVQRCAGAPFSVGDQVLILQGRRKGKIAEVYEVWSERRQVRLRLSDDERETVSDVFSDHQILRKRKPNQSALPTPV